MRRTTTLAASVLLTCTALAAFGQDAMPTGTISYFTGPCPQGWNASQIPDAALGRTIIATPAGGTPLQGVGDPLDGRDDLTHRHSIQSVDIDVGDAELGLFQACCNKTLGEGGEQEVSFAMPNGSSGQVPYLFLNVCVKVADPDPAPVPSGLMAFQPRACPAGTTEYSEAAGRFIYGAPSGVAPGTASGGPSMTPGEVPTHVHTLDYIQIDIDDKQTVASDCCTEGWAEAGHIHVTTTTDEVARPGDASNAVNAPYFTANLCRVN